MNRSLEDEVKHSAETALAKLARGDKTVMAAWLRRHLFEYIIPFWERQALDKKAGAIYTSVNARGEVLSRDRWMWGQWRAVWIFSRIYNHLDRDPKWLEYARSIADFCIAHGWDKAGDGWALHLSPEGKMLRGSDSIHTDGFALYGLTEFYLATGDEAVLEVARKTADAVLRKLARPYDTVPHAPYPIPAGGKPHAIPMVFALKLAELGSVLKDEGYLREAAKLSDEVFRDFYRRDRDVILEFVGLDGRELNTPQGRAINPGHAIEDMWFQVHVCDLLGGNPARVAEAFRLTLRHMEIGWDAKYGGGIRLAVDANGGDQAAAWDFADAKLFWPHLETLYALLLGWERTGQRDFFDWYERIWQLCLVRYVDWENGEWRRNLQRDLKPLDQSKTFPFPVRDPFHIFRSLILQIELLERKGGAPTADQARAAN